MGDRLHCPPQCLHHPRPTVDSHADAGSGSSTGPTPPSSSPSRTSFTSQKPYDVPLQICAPDVWRPFDCSLVGCPKMAGLRIKAFLCKTIGDVKRCGDVGVESSPVGGGTYESEIGPTTIGIRAVTEVPGVFPPVAGAPRLKAVMWVVEVPAEDGWGREYWLRPACREQATDYDHSDRR